MIYRPIIVETDLCSQVMANPFDTARRLLTKNDIKNTSFNEKLDLYFVDYDIMPLYMQENYISAYLYGSTFSSPEDEVRASDVLAGVADCLTLGDLLNSKVRREGQWSLLGDVGLFTAVVPACQAAGFIARPEFPKWLGRNSTTTKNRRLLNELQLYLAPSTTTTPVQMRTSGYLDLLYEKILAPLNDSKAQDPKEQAQECMKLIDACGLTRDQVVENLGSLRLKRQKFIKIVCFRIRFYDLIDSSLKRSLTTLYNASTHSIRMAPPTFSVKKKAKGPSKETEDDGGEDATAPIKEEERQKEQAPPQSAKPRRKPQLKRPVQNEKGNSSHSSTTSTVRPLIFKKFVARKEQTSIPSTW
ncbi:replication factor C subunit 1-like [Condylostylus longicornis]|uniref:replication factor C subunit 1-like n=1 Tax=Condylostylus longicornis TaxID=2530218 RepID=UPI00244E1FD7|nr:replication factor C subunit 1-like [Condylostylus longicornis]